MEYSRYLELNNPPSNIIIDLNSQSLINRYFPNTILIIKKLIYRILGEKTGKLNLLEWAPNEMKATFQLQTNNKSYNVVINKDKILLISNEYELTYLIRDLVEYLVLELKKYIIKKEKSTYIETFNGHKKIIEVLFKDEKLSRIEMMLDTYETMENSIQNAIEKAKDIQELKNIYFKYFYYTQGYFNQSQNTILSIGEIIKKKEIILDQIILKEGKIQEFQLGKRVGNIIAIKKEHIYTFYEIEPSNNQVSMDIIGEELRIKQRKLLNQKKFL